MARANSSETSTKGTRPRKSAAEKAQADLDRATKAVEKNQQSVEKYQFALNEANTRLDESKRYLDYVSRNPALPQDEAGDVPGVSYNADAEVTATTA